MIVKPRTILSQLYLVNRSRSRVMSNFKELNKAFIRTTRGGGENFERDVKVFVKSSQISSAACVNKSIQAVCSRHVGSCEMHVSVITSCV